MSVNHKSLITSSSPVLIIGAGPAGLFLGLWLHYFDIPFKIFEKKPDTHQHSRAIGIHPVSLDLFDRLGLIDSFRNAGKQIKFGIGYLGQERIGRLDFSELPFTHPYILTLPQHKTEQILREALLEREPNCIKFNAELNSFRQTDEQVQAKITTRCTEKDQTESIYRGSYLIGCDGRHSTVRAQSSIQWKGKPYPDTYTMGDFRGSSPDLDPAFVHLHPAGVVESFALPQGHRRWVVKTKEEPASPLSKIISALRKRINHELNESDCIRCNSFGIEQYQSRPIFQKRTILAGDAAHVVSPIGGQGMNLGWMGTTALAHSLKQINDGVSARKALTRYEHIQQGRVQKAIRRAAFNTKLGRAYQYNLPRRLLLHGMLNTPLRKITTRLFTMHGLDRWPI